MSSVPTLGGLLPPDAYGPLINPSLGPLPQTPAQPGQGEVGAQSRGGPGTWLPLLDGLPV